MRQQVSFLKGNISYKRPFFSLIAILDFDKFDNVCISDEYLYVCEVLSRPSLQVQCYDHDEISHKYTAVCKRY